MNVEGVKLDWLALGYYLIVLLILSSSIIWLLMKHFRIYKIGWIGIK